MRRLSLAALLLVALIPWVQLAQAVDAAAVALMLAACSAPVAPAPQAPEFPPGPTIAAHVLAHGQVGLAAAHQQDIDEALAAVHLTGDEHADWRARADVQSLVDARWLPVWAAWHDLKASQHAYEEAAARGWKPNDHEVTAALCALREAVPARWRPAVLPDLREVCR